MTISAERPIFIVGAARSGTTLLRFMLCGHPRIYIPPQSDFIPRLFHSRPRDPMTRRQAIRAVSVIFSSRPFIKDWRAERPDAAAFVDSLPDLRPGTLLDTLYGQYARRHEAERWGDKTPTYTGYMDLIAEIFPTAQFIHIIRDGRDVALSTIQAYRKDIFYVDMYFAARSWKERVQKALASATRLGPDRYYELRYEQLTANPEARLREICEFLGETFVPAMTEPQKLARERLSAKNVHAAVRHPPTTSSVGRFRREMSEADQRLVQAVAGDLLDELGYGTVHFNKMPLGERGRYVGLQTKYTILESGRRVLQTVGLVSPH